MLAEEDLQERRKLAMKFGEEARQRRIKEHEQRQAEIRNAAMVEEVLKRNHVALMVSANGIQTFQFLILVTCLSQSIFRAVI